MEDEYEHLDRYLFYTTSNIPGPGIDEKIFTEEFARGCKCIDNCVSECSCGMNYISGKLMNFSKGFYECNSACACNRRNRCVNKIVALGPRKNLEIFQTNKGLGLRCAEDITKGEFICEYAGEVIDIHEAKKRFDFQQKNNYSNYIFILNEFFGQKLEQTIIDPSSIGNIGRYINHSCDPNCKIVPVRCDIVIPKLGIFAKKDIKSLEEITFDYGNGSYNDLRLRNQSFMTKCLCNSSNCRKFLPFSSNLFM